jgi:hypothetical protein
MNTTLLAAILVLASPQAQDSAAKSTQKKAVDPTLFTDPYLGLAFTHPKTWTLLKKSKDTTRYSIAVEGSPDTAEIDLVRSPFHSTKDIWQSIQLKANETLHRQVVRQWEQDVIKVPMLCTQLSYTDKDVPKSTLTGLYYTKTPLKMLVRLTAPAADFDKVKYEFDQSLETLHTTNGTTPQEDDPDFKFAETKKPQLAPPTPDIIDNGAPATPKLIRGESRATVDVSTKSVTLKFPRDWKADGIKAGELQLHHAKLGSSITFSVHYSLDSERPATALIHATGPELSDFLPGVKREDTEPTQNVAGCSISTVWRFGKTASGDLCTFHASGEQGDFYFIAAFRATSVRELREDQRLIRSLMDDISLTTGTP